MVEMLMYISNGLIIFSFIYYFILVLIGRSRKITNDDGFNITKDLLNHYNTINIILNKGYFTVYNIKRKVIKIANRCYYGNTLSDIALPFIEASISLVHDKKNKCINFISKLIPNLKLLYILSLIAIIINSQTYNISDAKVSIVFFSLFAVLNYIIIDIKSKGLVLVQDNINKIKAINSDNRDKVINFMNKLNFIDKLIFMSELIMIIRCVMIMLEM